MFHRDAYLAQERQDLIKGVEEFLQCSIVLPPSEIQNEQLLKDLVPLQRELLKKRYLPVEKKPELEIEKDVGTAQLGGTCGLWRNLCEVNSQGLAPSLLE